MTESRGFGTFDGTKPLICRHPYITVFAEENGPLRMWACSECKIRFYPACEICVTIGHRNEVHEPVAKLRRNAVMVEQEALIDDLRADLIAAKEMVDTDCCDYACYEDPGCLCDPCKIIKLERIREAAKDISRPTYVDEEQVIAHVPLSALEALRKSLREYSDDEEVECPCCKDWFTLCDDVTHGNELHMCAFCTLGQHDLEAACYPE